MSSGRRSRPCGLGSSGTVRLTRFDLLLALTLLGVGIAAYLTFVGWSTEVEPYCSGLGDCSAVQSSEFGDIAGIPIATFGLAMYLGLLVLLLAHRAGPLAGRPLLLVWYFAVALSGVLYSAYLTYLELWVIEAICVWCVASAVVVTVILVVAWPAFGAARRALAGAAEG